MPKVLIAPATLAHQDGPHVQILREAGFEISYPAKAKQMTEEELRAELSGVWAALAGSEPYTRRVLQSFPELKVIARAGVGYDGVDVAAATERGIAVTITPGANHDAVAEHTFAFLLAAAKQVLVNDREMRASRWKRGPTLPLRGRTLGIVGLGRIGKSVALLARAFHMKVLACESYPDQDFISRHGIRLVPLEEVLAEADYVTLHVPLTPESQHLINHKTIALMKPTAFLINTARGGLVCEADLVAALRARRLAGAALDVFEQEPPGEHAYYGLDNVILSPHIAGIDQASLVEVAVMAAQTIVALHRGEWPAERIVNPEIRNRR